MRLCGAAHDLRAPGNASKRSFARRLRELFFVFVSGHTHDVPQSVLSEARLCINAMVQVCRPSSVGVCRELRLNPFDEPMKVCARPSRHAYALPPGPLRLVAVPSPCLRLPAAQRLVSGRQLSIWVWGAAPLATPLGGDGGALLRCQEGVPPPPALRTRAQPPHPTRSLTPLWAIVCAQARL